MIADKGLRHRARRRIRPGHLIAALAACGALVLPAAVATQVQAQVSAAGAPCTDCTGLSPQDEGVYMAGID
jgi:hypothetical protein